MAFHTLNKKYPIQLIQPTLPFVTFVLGYNTYLGHDINPNKLYLSYIYSNELKVPRLRIIPNNLRYINSRFIGLCKRSLTWLGTKDTQRLSPMQLNSFPNFLNGGTAVLLACCWPVYGTTPQFHILNIGS